MLHSLFWAAHGRFCQLNSPVSGVQKNMDQFAGTKIDSFLAPLSEFISCSPGQTYFLTGAGHDLIIYTEYMYFQIVSHRCSFAYTGTKLCLSESRILNSCKPYFVFSSRPKMRSHNSFLPNNSKIPYNCAYSVKYVIPRPEWVKTKKNCYTERVSV